MVLRKAANKAVSDGLFSTPLFVIWNFFLILYLELKILILNRSNLSCPENYPLCLFVSHLEIAGGIVYCYLLTSSYQLWPTIHAYPHPVSKLWPCADGDQGFQLTNYATLRRRKTNVVLLKDLFLWICTNFLLNRCNSRMNFIESSLIWTISSLQNSKMLVSASFNLVSKIEKISVFWWEK